MNRENSISNNPFKAENGDVTYNLYVDGKKVESKTATWQPKANGSGFWLDDENIVFGQDPDKKIVIDGKWKSVKVAYYNFDGDVSTTKNPQINMYLKRDENGVYSLYLPYIKEDGKYVDLFYLEETVGNGNGLYETIYDLNPDAKPLAEIKPIYEYVFVATNEELPPEPHTPEEPKTNVRVSKVWEALGETTSIRVELYVNGEATGRYMTLSEANGWTATFYDLDEYDHLGNRYVYTVREVGDANGIYKLGDREFEVSYAGNMDKGFTITNKEIPPEEPEEPEEPETPEPKEPEEPEEPEDEGGGKNIIPKTGVKTDSKSIYLSLILLMALVVLKRKKYSK